MRFVSLPTSSFVAPLRSRPVLAISFLVGVVYLFLQSALLNATILTQTVEGSMPFVFKFHLVTSILIGYLAMFPLQELIFTLLTALLVGLNFSLVIALMQSMQRSGRVKFSFGGVSVLALASTGCPSCGLTILSLLGPSTGVVALALHSLVAQVSMLLILSASIIYSLHKLQTSRVCKIKI